MALVKWYGFAHSTCFAHVHHPKSMIPRSRSLEFVQLPWSPNVWGLLTKEQAQGREITLPTLECLKRPDIEHPGLKMCLILKLLSQGPTKTSDFDGFLKLEAWINYMCFGYFFHSIPWCSCFPSLFFAMFFWKWPAAHSSVGSMTTATGETWRPPKKMGKEGKTGGILDY